MSYATILFAIDGPVARLTLNRPDKLNSFTAEMHGELADAFTRIESPESGARAVLITGTGRGFCAGQDLGQRRGGEAPDLGHTIDTLYNPLIRRMRALKMPIVCAVNGVAAGAGANFAFACDIVLAARSASFMQAFARIGLVPDSGGTWILPRLAGPARARALAMLAERITAEQAAAWGLIWQVVDDDRLAAEAAALAERLAAMPTRALGAIKMALDAAETSTLDAQLDRERDLQRELGRSADYAEGVAAFLEKRAPAFKGR
ncbi:MAG: 2-(1,2-epoxy-1,2-dihydrophenyl)acetyl-CoA isomerase [Alphaproteobacteria bacterium]|nr:2-(1,2-epoxy-1,2-dihydrophenyl)acetyl-CoA isomerase [Alphaproteobacteria bacterium]